VKREEKSRSVRNPPLRMILKKRWNPSNIIKNKRRENKQRKRRKKL